MALDKALDSILNTGTKVKVVRLFISKREDFMASGRQIARLINITAPAAHAALKELYNHDILKRDIIGKQHIYKLNAGSRIVKNILVPAFKKESGIKEDISKFLKQKIRTAHMQDKIASIILYGSLQTNTAGEKSDVDIALITKNDKTKNQIERIFFVEGLIGQFHDYFGVHLDVYLKTKDEFVKRMRKNLPPVSTFIKSYSVIYGTDPIELK